ncbi:MAG: hypothetical protein IJY49_03825, partial [Clostridia bacterium]|nr:hypothetical protein [Clostridia bacterium]
FVTDDITSVFFNIKPTKKELDLIDIDDFEEDLSSYKKVQTLSPPSRQTKPKPIQRFRFLFYMTSPNSRDLNESVKKMVDTHHF